MVVVGLVAPEVLLLEVRLVLVALGGLVGLAAPMVQTVAHSGQVVLEVAPAGQMVGRMARGISPGPAIDRMAVAAGRIHLLRLLRPLLLPALPAEARQEE